MKFQLEPYHRQVSNDELLNDLRRVASETGKQAVTRDQQDERGTFHSTTFVRRFGSWFNALDKAGLERTRTQMNTPDEDLFRNLEAVWISLGRQPRYQDIQKPLSKFNIGTYENRFGGWRNALERFVAYVNGETASIKGDSLIKSNLHKTKRDINWRVRFLVMRRDHFKCQSCGRSPATDPTIVLHVDHRIAWANGGETVVDNLQTLCSRCNIGKSNL